MNASRIPGLLCGVALSLAVAGCGGGDKGADLPAEDGGQDVATDPGVALDPGTGTDPGGGEDPGVGDPGSGVDPGMPADAGPDAPTQAQRYLRSDQAADAVGPALPGANTAFAVKLFKAMNAAEGAGANLFVSPFSVSTALSMVYLGATGDTRTAMAQTLEFAGIDPALLDDAWKHLIHSLENVDDDVTLAIADSVWMDTLFAPRVKAAFLDAVVAVFDSEVFTLDFDAPDARDTINGWVEDHTNGRIQDLIDQIPDTVVMYLINALYFKADWLYPFDSENTAPATFTLADGSTKDVDMMRFPDLVTSFAFAADADFCAVRLPYGRDKVAFYGFVPWGHGGEKTIEDFVAELTPEGLEAWCAGVALPQGEGDGLRVWLPKFKIEYKKVLNEVLEALGMGPAFSGGFDGIAEGIFISRVIHQTFIEVNEEGTEAAAATAVEMDEGESPHFVPTRPFFFVIRDDRTGTILFMGKVADPAAE